MRPGPKILKNLATGEIFFFTLPLCPKDQKNTILVGMNWRSYLKPIVLYQAVSSRGVRIEVREKSGVRELYLDGYPQTQKKYRHDWAKLLRNLASCDTLLLGLGGGDVVKLLQESKVTAVELEPEVVAVAREYFGIVPSGKLITLAEDAEKFMDRNEKKYDLVVVDLYSGDGVPEFVESRKFLENVRAALRPHGTVLVNYASHNFGTSEFEDFEKKLRKVFAHVGKRVIWGHTFYRITL